MGQQLPTPSLPDVTSCSVGEHIREDWTPADGSLVPHTDAPHTDIFQNDEGFFIVRSDLGCYLWTKDIQKPTSIEIKWLHPACRGGDHYLGSIGKDIICIIKGNSYRLVKDLSTDAEATVHELHPKWRGGDHYMLSVFGFCAIFLERGVLRNTMDLSTDEKGGEVPMLPEFCQGLYYFSYNVNLTLIKVDDKWGPHCYLYSDIRSSHYRIFSIHPNVLNFFPGGLTLTKGTSISGWECIKTLHNKTDSSFIWSNKVSRKVGYAKQQMSSIEHNWSISNEMSLTTGALTKLITQSQFYLNTQYGGRSISTKQEDWNEAREEEESIQVTLEPQKNLYIWQYRLGIGQEPVLFCRDIELTEENNPPDRVLLPLVP